MARPALVATDLDGTVVRPDGTISERTVAAFARVEEAGAEFVVATGRPPRLVDEIAARFGDRGVAICSNGAFLYDMHERKVIEEHGISPEDLTEAVRRLRKEIPGIGIAVEHAVDLVADDLYEPWEWDRGATVVRADDEVLLSRPAPKLLGRHPELSADELLALAAPALAGLVTASHSNGSRLVEAVALGVNKAAALARLAQRCGIGSDQVIAFGDMPNDLPMLSWSGTAYGVANAHPDVLAMVDHVIGSNREDGVAAVLENLYPGANEGASADE
ncbi:HAD family hydrolase [Amycolatopsis benzoatilytica]|uniref:HAD family hydrolase n=1 Tax=Amycolatopsis benzoatilytica TaxID=346045 RepID=UPI000364AD2E|nr:HAD-IIB family hydrolase [Amycolatopsis benzoatilytica]